LESKGTHERLLSLPQARSDQKLFPAAQRNLYAGPYAGRVGGVQLPDALRGSQDTPVPPKLQNHRQSRASLAEHGGEACERSAGKAADCHGEHRDRHQARREAKRHAALHDPPGGESAPALLRATDASARNSQRPGDDPKKARRARPQTGASGLGSKIKQEKATALQAAPSRTHNSRQCRPLGGFCGFGDRCHPGGCSQPFGVKFGAAVRRLSPNYRGFYKGNYGATAWCIA